jgi:uncharacterized RDD family membrane protein YckC
MQVACPRCQAVLEYASQRPAFCSQCGLALTPSPAGPTTAFEPAATGGDLQPAGSMAAAPEQIGGYRLVRPLGSGGMGTVYEAEDTASGRRVALKLIAPDYANSAETIERFRREGRLASTLSHPRCVFVLAADEEAGRPYIVMELMPGRTLEDVVAEQGPMTPIAAITCILDVLEGLQEAHRLGFIHRDVKPSNCFLDAQGRVKVGDFGLAKSLVPSDRLTRTGSFLGTVLFAAPEQIKGEALDPQTDVYGAAATLYYLLTGQAPFAGGDAAATLARAVSEPAPPMRSLRPELDPVLDAVVLRGLERDRGRRWRSLAEFKAALLPFLPAPLPFATLGIRFVAYLLDSLILLLIYAILAIVLGKVAVHAGPARFETTMGTPPEQGLPLTVDVIYFVLLEGLWGASLGKRLLRLRVRRASTNARPGLGRVLLRTLVYIALLELGSLALLVSHLAFKPPGVDDVTWARNAPISFVLVNVLPVFGMPLGILLLLGPMRARNGYRGLHEWLSDTRTVRLPRPERRRVLTGRPRELPVSQPDGMPAVLGPFVVRGAIRWDESARVLLGQDRGLGRSVWLWLRPTTDPPLSAVRRDISRPTRLRWLACGRHADWQWDAFMAFNGSPLPPRSRRREESWPRALPLLEQLTDELATASAEGALPSTLHPNQVWVGPDGQVQLLDLPLDATGTEGAVGPDRALTLLTDVAALALEGQPRGAGRPGSVRAPIPLHARPSLDRLLGAGKAYRDVGEFHKDLKALADEPAEVVAHRRATHLVVLATFLFLGMGCCMLPAGLYNQFFPFDALVGSIHEKEQRLTDLEHWALVEFAEGTINPEPQIRLQAAVQLEADYQLQDRLRQSLDRDQRQRAARLESSSWLSRNALEQIERQAAAEWKTREAERVRKHPELFGPDHFRSRAQRLVDSPFPDPDETPPPTLWLATLIAWPALWVIWAFLARGGISYRLAGIALVRGDGRPASRLQCGWRALLVWTPLTALLVLSLWLEEHYWSLWQPDASPTWLLSLASAVWYAALLLLAGYVLLALWRPARTLHDRLSGVYLVPR